MENHQHFGNNIAFVPTLYMKDLEPAVEFYQKAFNATVYRTIDYEGRMHVAEMAIGKAPFRLHEETTKSKQFGPDTLNGTSVVLGLFVADPHKVQAQAIAAGAVELNPVQDYNYGYRQGTVRDPFGHHWMIEMDKPLNSE